MMIGDQQPEPFDLRIKQISSVSVPELISSAQRDYNTPGKYPFKNN